jgi:CheY-like chemotaxis protein
MNPDSFIILSVEDNKPDFLLLKEALEKIEDIDLQVKNVSNGKDALDWIYKRNGYNDSPTPHLIILDLNLPQISGYEVLKKLKSHKKNKSIPVIIYSTSDDHYDIQTCYKMHANSYVTKTFDIKELFEKIASLGNYWLKTSEMPYKNILKNTEE